MKTFSTRMLVLGGCLLAGTAQAQYTFTNSNLAPYKQDFNSLPIIATLTSGRLTAMPEVYAQAEFATGPYAPPAIGANDGLNILANYYHFGSLGGADRSLGGIASTAFTDGVGHVGVRLKNGSSITIKNLEVLYAMEQWYNSGRQDAASVSVSYRTAPVGTTITSLAASSGTWQTIAPLQVDAPSTSTVIASRDGNSAANRRVRQTTLSDLNLLPGQEIMIRWSYTLSSATNGNGLSIDDVVITPETNVFYSKPSGNLDVLTNWGTYKDGSGTSPTSFSNDNQTFYVLGNTAADRITTTGTSGIVGTWAVSGANSKIIVGIPAAPNTGTAIVPATLYLEYNKSIAGTIDVADGSTFVIRNTNLPRPYTLGALGLSSTVNYNGGTAVPIITQSYGNLVISSNTAGAAPKTLAGNIVVNGSVLLKNCSLNLDAYNLTLVRRDSLNAGGVKLNANIVRGASTSSYIITGGTGKLQISVPNNGVDILFPVGTAASYTPAILSQTAANSEDIFSVRVINNLYANYTAAESGSGSPLSQQCVNRTWLVSEEVPGGSDLKMKLQWNAGDATSDLVASQTRLKHYTNGAWDQHANPSEWGLLGGLLARAGITSFSPFGVVSVAPLPVKLTNFEARATGADALCTWATATETNNDHFVVERSLDGQHFAAVGTVQGQGTSSKATGYRFVDEAAARLGAATVYYRLQQVDTDGQTSFGPVRTVAFATKTVALYPSPATGDAATLDLNGLPTQAYQVQVLDLTGRVLLAQSLVGAQAHRLDLRSLPAGAYLVQVQGAGIRQTLPFLRN